MRIWIVIPAVALLTAACGETVQQRAVTGGAGGALAGGVIGGPIGALVGAGAGAAGGAYRDTIAVEGDQFVGDTTRELAMGGTPAQVDPPASRARAAEPSPMAERTRPMAGPDALTNREVRDAQVALRDMGLYDGQIDGLYGTRTIRAVEEFQTQENLPRTRALDGRTQQRIQEAAVASPAQQRTPDAAPPGAAQPETPSPAPQTAPETSPSPDAAPGAQPAPQGTQ